MFARALLLILLVPALAALGALRVGIVRDAGRIDEAIAAALREQGASVELIAPDGAITQAKFDALVLPDAPHVPSSMANDLAAFARAGGDLVLLGGRPFSDPVQRVGNRWLSRSDALAHPTIRKSTSLLPRQAKQWRHDTSNPDAGSTATLAGDRWQFVIHKLAGWDTFGLSIPAFPPAATAIRLRIRADSPDTTRAALELRERDGSRWVAVLPLASDFREHILAPESFRYFSGAKQRGMYGDCVRLSECVFASVGLAKGLTVLPPGEHGFSVATLDAVEATIPSASDLSALELTVPFKHYDLPAGATAVAASGAAAIWGDVPPPPRSLGSTIFALPRFRQSVLMPLIEARQNGKTLGPLAAIMANHAKPFAGSHWLIGGAADADYWRDQRVCAAISRALIAMADGTIDRLARQRQRGNLFQALGVTHMHGLYHLTDKEFLQEGLDQLAQLGTRTVKLSLSSAARMYPFNTTWPKVKSLAEAAQTPQFERAFSGPFDNYILWAFTVGQDGAYWRDRITPENVAEETRQFHDLARHLLTRYANTNKTFVLQNWEGDWPVRGHQDRNRAPSPEALANMVTWMRARQAGVEQARREVGEHGVRVLHALEANLINPCFLDDAPGVARDVLPRAGVDLVSWSCYEAQDDPVLLRAGIDYLARQIGDSKRVYIGEYGKPENRIGLERLQRVIPAATDVVLASDCPWAIYWQLYCNEPRSNDPRNNEPRNTPVKSNDDVAGFWMIKVDGTKAWTWDYYRKLIAGE